MMPPPKKKIFPPPKASGVPAGFYMLQPNRAFDNEAEILSVYKDAKIVKVWKSAQIYCEILLPVEKAVTNKTK